MPNPADDAPHLLVVDDDRRIRALLSRFLLAEGYRVSTADNAVDARAKLAGLKFDLLILDVMMPGENGFDFARSIRSDSAVPILMLTARDEAESRIRGWKWAPTIICRSRSSRASFHCGWPTFSSELGRLPRRPLNRCALARSCFIWRAVNCAAAKR